MSSSRVMLAISRDDVVCPIGPRSDVVRAPNPTAWSARRMLAMGAAGAGLLAVLAVRAGITAPESRLGLVVLDVLVGLAFVAAGWIAPGPIQERSLFLGVGYAWLVGSLVPSLGSVHQAVLAVALVAFPSGRIRGPVVLVAAAGAILLAVRPVPQLGVASLFAVVTVMSAVTGRSRGATSAYPIVASACVAAALALSWASHRFDLGAVDPTFTLVVYEAVLLLIAAVFPIAARAVVRARERLADEIVANMALEGLEGVAVALRAALGDPTLFVYRWDASASAYVDDRRRPVGRDDVGRQRFAVAAANEPLALVVHRSGGLEDAPTASAVASAVRLAVTNLRLTEELHDRLLELQASRGRLFAAADRAREEAVGQLRDVVETSLRDARSELSAVRIRDQEAKTAIVVAADELEATSGMIADLVMGVPPDDLGGGRLRDALGALVRRSPVRVSLAVDEHAGGTEGAEATLYYVISESIANVSKHAAATRIDVRVERRGGHIVATVSDDGRGGADPSGSGLQGLSDRLAVRGGRLRVESPPGAGTTVVATIPD